MTLYPLLEDHELVQKYPAVRGLPKNVLFIDHKGKESGADDESVSKHNKFEVCSTLSLMFLRLSPLNF